MTALGLPLFFIIVYHVLLKSGMVIRKWHELKARASGGQLEVVFLFNCPAL